MRLFARIFWRPPDLHNVCWEDGSTAIFFAQLWEMEGLGYSPSPCTTEAGFPQKSFAESVYHPYPGWFYTSRWVTEDPRCCFSARYGGKRRWGIAMATANWPRAGSTSEGATNAGNNRWCWKRWAKKHAPMSSRTHRELGSTQLVQRVLVTSIWASQVPLTPLHFFASLWICRSSRAVSVTGGILIINLQREVCIIREWLWRRTPWSPRQLRCPGVFSTSPWCTNLQCWSSKHRCWVSPPQCCMALSTTGSKAMALASRWLRTYPVYSAQMSGGQHFFSYIACGQSSKSRRFFSPRFSWSFTKKLVFCLQPANKTRWQTATRETSMAILDSSTSWHEMYCGTSWWDCICTSRMEAWSQIWDEFEPKCCYT